MRPSTALLAAPLTGCIAAPTGAGPVSWAGYVFADPYTSEELLTGGSFEVLELQGGCVLDDADACIVGEESDGTAGYWSVDVPRSTPVALRLQAAGSAPTVWRVTTPRRDAQWLNGGLFTRDLAAIDAFVAELGPPWATAVPLSSSADAWMWGAPLDPTAWIGASLTLTGGDGAEVAVLALTQADDGAVSVASATDPVDLLLATDIAPGAVTLTVQAADGREAVEAWPAQPGDLLSAVFLALPSGSE